MTVLATRSLNAFEVVAPTAYIVQVNTARPDISFQERSQPVKITLGGQAGVQVLVDSTSTLPATFRTTMDLIRPDGSVADSIYWEEEISPSSRKTYEQWFTLDEDGLWQVDITLESVTSVSTQVLDRASVGLRAGVGEESWMPSLTTIGIVAGLCGLGLVLWAANKK